MVDSEIDGLPTANTPACCSVDSGFQRNIDVVESREGKFHETWDPNQI
jgi:hypothetical protein